VIETVVKCSGVQAISGVFASCTARPAARAAVFPARLGDVH